MRSLLLLIVAHLAHIATLGSSFLPLSPQLSTFRLHATAPSPTAFDLPTYISSRLPLITTALETSLLDQTIPQTKTITDSMLYSLMAGGKRIRPMLCLLTADLFTPSSFEDNYPAVLPTAVAVEMIHTMSLIHDDLPAMDDDDFRRGKPTNHKVYGEDVAVLAGDALLSTAFAFVAKETDVESIEGGEKERRLLEVIGRLGESVSGMGLAGGQVMDLQCEGKPSAELTLEDLQWIHIHKTAKLLNLCCACSAILCGADEKEVMAVERFADKIGLAFQVSDDILDITQSSEELGKTAGKDELADKATYVKMMGLAGARAEAAKLVREAKECLDELCYGERADGLKAIADYIIDRQN